MYLDLTEFDWRNINEYQSSICNKLFLIEPVNGMVDPYVRQQMDVLVKLNNKRYEITLQKKGDIA